VIANTQPLGRTLLNQLAETMFASDVCGRLMDEAPHVHVLRTPAGVLCRCHADLPDDLADEIDGLVRRPRRRPREWAQTYADIVGAVTSVLPLTALRAGPLYCFPEALERDEVAISIGADNVGLLSGGLEEWAADVPAGLPMMAVVADGHAVSICASVRASRSVHCAGVETVEASRGRGFGAHAVMAWAGVVQMRGATPIYGTTFDNVESQRLARRLGLHPIGSEFSLDCRPQPAAGIVAS
jgi:hypothetical protein